MRESTLFERPLSPTAEARLRRRDRLVNNRSLSTTPNTTTSVDVLIRSKIYKKKPKKYNGKPFLIEKKEEELEEEVHEREEEDAHVAEPRTRHFVMPELMPDRSRAEEMSLIDSQHPGPGQKICVGQPLNQKFYHFNAGNEDDGTATTDSNSMPTEGSNSNTSTPNRPGPSSFKTTRGIAYSIHQPIDANKYKRPLVFHNLPEDSSFDGTNDADEESCSIDRQQQHYIKSFQKASGSGPMRTRHKKTIHKRERQPQERAKEPRRLAQSRIDTPVPTIFVCEDKSFVEVSLDNTSKSKRVTFITASDPCGEETSSTDTKDVHKCASFTCESCRFSKTQLLCTDQPSFIARPLRGTKWWELPETKTGWLEQKMQPLFDFLEEQEGSPVPVGSCRGGACSDPQQEVKPSPSLAVPPQTSAVVKKHVDTILEQNEDDDSVQSLQVSVQ